MGAGARAGHVLPRARAYGTPAPPEPRADPEVDSGSALLFVPEVLGYRNGLAATPEALPVRSSDLGQRLREEPAAHRPDGRRHPQVVPAPMASRSTRTPPLGRDTQQIQALDAGNLPVAQATLGLHPERHGAVVHRSTEVVVQALPHCRRIMQWRWVGDGCRLKPMLPRESRRGPCFRCSPRWRARRAVATLEPTVLGEWCVGLVRMRLWQPRADGGDGPQRHRRQCRRRIGFDAG